MALNDRCCRTCRHMPAYSTGMGRINYRYSPPTSPCNPERTYRPGQTEGGLCTHAGDWLNAPPLTAIGLRLSNEDIRVAVAYRLGAVACQPHTCECSSLVETRGLHGLSCRKSTARHIRHSQLNDIIWRAIKRAQIPSSKEPLGLSRSDGKRPDGVTLLP